MPYPGWTRLCALAAKIESTPGTDSAPSMAANAIRLLGAAEPQEVFLSENETADMQTGGLGQFTPPPPSARAWRVPIRWAPIGAGVAYSASVFPECDVLLRIAGMAVTTVLTGGSESQTYKPSDAPTSTATCIVQISGKQYKLLFTVLESLKLTVINNNYPIFEASLLGIDGGMIEQALQAPTYANVALPIFKGASSFAVGGVNPVTRQIGADWNLSVAPRGDGNAGGGHSGYIITRRKPMLNATIEMSAISTIDPNADKLARTIRAITATIGSTQYKRMKLKADGSVIVKVQDKDDNGLRGYAVDYQCPTPTSGSELDVAFD